MHPFSPMLIPMH